MFQAVIQTPSGFWAVAAPQKYYGIKAYDDPLVLQTGFQNVASIITCNQLQAETVRIKIEAVLKNTLKSQPTFLVYRWLMA